MNCREAGRLLPAYVDDELDLPHSLEWKRTWKSARPAQPGSRSSAP